jgi:hypothetical protein
MISNRSLLPTGLLAALRRVPLVLSALVAMTAAAAAGDGWDGTWHGGFDNDGDGVQIIMIGPQVTGFYYHGDYLDTDTGTAAADGAVTFHWDSGEGTLADDGGKRRLTVHETGKADRVIPLERDN